jgi:hypothetical protein
MTRSLDVLVLENRPGSARIAVEELTAAGHRVHRCHQPGTPSFPCRGVVDAAACPLQGPIDVALVVRHHIHPQPSSYEHGVACAIRAGVPLVEEGSAILDPYDPWVTARVEAGSVAEVCAQAVERGHQPVAADVLERCAPLLDAHGIDLSAVACRIELWWPRLQVHIDLPVQVTDGVREALAVRALDAVRASRRTYGTVNVQVHDTTS